jgi:hypothetical protein
MLRFYEVGDSGIREFGEPPSNGPCTVFHLFADFPRRKRFGLHQRRKSNQKSSSWVGQSPAKLSRERTQEQSPSNLIVIGICEHVPICVSLPLELVEQCRGLNQGQGVRKGTPRLDAPVVEVLCESRCKRDEDAMRL